MATELGKAYVQIVPSAKGISSSISQELDAPSKQAGESAGFNIAGAIKNAIVAAGIGGAIKNALDAGGAIQQSFGGLDTLYEDAADQAKKYAVEAAAAGISANTYAEQAVSVGAALKAAFGGDNQAAMEAANLAILDMADNSAKMGSDISSVQAAYAGFAKGQYTLLDNLKLGYGGTKTEMQRLLEDATKLSGVEYDLENLGDVYSAIHVIQENLGLTGVAAAEASETFSGSMGAMQAAAENLMANIALGEDLGPALDTLQQSVRNFLINNLLPMVGNIISSTPELVAGILQTVMMLLGNIKRIAEEENLIEVAVDIITGIIESIFEMTPYILENIWYMLTALKDSFFEIDWADVGETMIQNISDSLEIAAAEIFGSEDGFLETFINSIFETIPSFIELGGELLLNFTNGILEALPNLLESGNQIIMQILTGIVESLPQIYDSGNTILQDVLAGISAALPNLLESGSKIIMQVLNGILSALPQMVKGASQLIMTFASFIMQNLPTILKSGIDILKSVVSGILQALPTLIETVVEVLDTFLKNITDNLPLVVEEGLALLSSLIQGILDNLPLLVECVLSLIFSIISTIAANLPSILQQGVLLITNIVSGIVQTIPQVVTSIINLICQAVKQFTSYDWGSVGRNLIQGIANGISSAVGTIVDAAKNAARAAFDAAKNFLGINSPATKGIYLGDMYDEGIAVGVEKNINVVEKSTDTLMNDAFSDLKAPMPSYDFVPVQNNQTSGDTIINMEINAADGMDVIELAELVAERINFNVKQKELAYA